MKRGAALHGWSFNTLPVAVIGNSSRHSTLLGTLQPAIRTSR
ncbi:hypothetical protein OHT57_42565 [Streptomyces sp. NBC_00285]|nr:hypothetical protein [Streptomyces sp. NBC_00285]